MNYLIKLFLFAALSAIGRSFAMNTEKAKSHSSLIEEPKEFLGSDLCGKLFFDINRDFKAIYSEHEGKRFKFNALDVLWVVEFNKMLSPLNVNDDLHKLAYWKLASRISSERKQVKNLFISLGDKSFFYSLGLVREQRLIFGALSGLR